MQPCTHLSPPAGLQKLHLMLHFGATLRCMRAARAGALVKQGWSNFGALPDKGIQLLRLA